MMSSNLMLAPSAFSLASRRSTAALFSTRSVLRSGRMTRRVSSSVACRIACFTLSCTGASLVAMKRVPMLMPSAPMRQRRDKLLPSATPPEATKGIFSSSAARGSRIKFGHVILAGMAAAFEAVDRDRVDSRCASAFSEWRTVVHLWMTLMPCFLQHRQPFRRVVAGGLDDLDAAIDDRLDVARVIGRA